MDFFFVTAVKFCNVGCVFLEMGQHELATKVLAASVQSIKISQEPVLSESHKAAGEKLKQLLAHVTQKEKELQDMSQSSSRTHMPADEDDLLMCTKPITISIEKLASLMQQKAISSTKMCITSTMLFNFALSTHLTAVRSQELRSQRCQHALKLYQLATKTSLGAVKDSAATKATCESRLMVEMAIQNNIGVLHQQFAEFSRCHKCFDTLSRLSRLKALKKTSDKDSPTKIGADNFAVIMLNVMAHHGGANQFAPVA